MNIIAKIWEQTRVLWLKLWNGRPPSIALLSPAVITALIMAIPIVYVFLRAIQGGIDQWLLLLNKRIPELLISTLSLTLVVTVGAIILGVISAYLIVRTDLPGKSSRS